MISAPQRIDPFRGIMAFPILPEATYRFLDELGGGWMLPGADGLEPDTAILLQTNPSFTSAFLVGMNHEMDGELLWRTTRPTSGARRSSASGNASTAASTSSPCTCGRPIRWRRPARRPGSRRRRRPTPRGRSSCCCAASCCAATRTWSCTPCAAPTPSRAARWSRSGARCSPGGCSRTQPRRVRLTPQQLAADEWWFVLEQQLTAPASASTSVRRRPACTSRRPTSAPASRRRTAWPSACCSCRSAWRSTRRLLLAGGGRVTDPGRHSRPTTSSPRSPPFPVVLLPVRLETRYVGIADAPTSCASARPGPGPRRRAPAAADRRRAGRRHSYSPSA